MIKYNGLSTLEVLEGAENYNSWIASNIRPYVKSPLLEVGAGSGNISNYFLDYKDFTLSDIDLGLVRLLKNKFKSKKVNIIKLDIENDSMVKQVNHFNSIFAVNVLEHIKNDSAALLKMYKAMNTGGKIILLVPANQFAYTKLDKELGHFRRYSKKELIKKVTEAGFKLERIKYFNILGLLTWIVRDRIEGENINLKPYQIALFDRIVPVLRFIESRLSIPIGISLILVARK